MTDKQLEYLWVEQFIFYLDLLTICYGHSQLLLPAKCESSK
jgi:hypothetical protein